jgi:hypothetical protein
MRRGAVALGAVLLLAACQPSPSVSPSPSHEAHESEHGHSAEPSASEPTSLCDPGVVCNGPLEDGDYVSEGTGAHVEFTLDDHDWSGLAETEGVGFGLLLADVPDAAMSVLAFEGEYFTDACDRQAGTSTIGRSPAEFMGMLTARPGITATEPVEVEVGGRPGLQVDLTTEIDDACAATGESQIAVWPLAPGGPFDLEDMEMARIIAVDGGSATLILVAEARSVVEDYDHFLEHFTELLETMTISPLPGEA